MSVPADKSLTHRGILLGLLAAGETRVERPLLAEDTRRSIALAQAFGARVTVADARLVIDSPGQAGLREPPDVFDCGNSGTTMRIGAGIAASVPGMTVLTGDASLRGRPMARVLDPLARLGATTLCRQDGRPPLAIRGRRLTGGRIELTVASAQVKSALLLAGLAADGPVTVVEPLLTRDHTERLLRAMGARVSTGDGSVGVEPGRLAPLTLTVPGDPSSAAFWWTWAVLAGRRVTTPGVLLNPTRIGFLDVLRRMGALVTVAEVREDLEPVGAVTVERGGDLAPIRIGPAEVPALIDELPLVALLATQADGTSEVSGAAELRVKESDRIAAVGEGLRALGAQVEDRPDGWLVKGPTPLRGAAVDSRGDHRVAMALMVAAAGASGPVTLRGAACAAVSYPGFLEALAEVGGVRRCGDERT